MSNNNTKKHSKQRKINRAQQIEAALVEWEKEAEQAAEEKASLGFKDFEKEAFLEILPENYSDIVLQSQIIDLQARYKELIQRQKFILAEDTVIKEFNEKHAIVHIDQTFILTEKVNTLGAKDFTLESRASFNLYYEDSMMLCIDGVERSKAEIWLKSPKRRKYKGIVFDPTESDSLHGYYNLWKGFTRQAKQGNCSKYWDHVKENICNNDEDKYRYVRKWLGFIFQKPDILHTALVLCGSQGVGKNSFTEPLGVLLGSHYAPLSSINELVSNFNFHLKNAVLIHANEALWGGNKKEIGTIKAMVTEQRCVIEGKGKDRIIVRNFKHIILSSNEDWPILISNDDRRFVVFNVSEKHKEDHKYFKEIQVQLDQDGYEALLYDLLHEDLTDFNPRQMPSNGDSFNIKMRSADSAHRYIYEVLSECGFSVGAMSESNSPVWQSTIPKNAVYDDYSLWCQKSGETTLSKTLFGGVVKKIIPSMEDTRPGSGSRQRCYKVPSIEKAREDFCKAFKENPARIFSDAVVLE